MNCQKYIINTNTVSRIKMFAYTTFLDICTILTSQRNVLRISEVETSLLVIVIDLHTRQRYLREQPSQLMHVLDSVVTLANMHLMLKTKNKVAIVACNASCW